MDISQLTDDLVADLRERTAPLLADLQDRTDALEAAWQDRVDATVDRFTEDPSPRWGTRLGWLALGAAAGAAALWFADPDRGASRRSEASDRVGAAVRGATDQAGGTAEHLANRASGLAAEAADAATGEDHPDAAVVEARIRSEVFGHRDDVDSVVLRFDGPGAVAVKGTVPSSDSERDLLAAIADVDGVVDVTSELSIAGA